MTRRPPRRALRAILAGMATLVLSESAAAQLAPPAAEPIRYARFPHVSNDGTIAFSYHGDIWLAGADGSNPRRLTAHVGRDISPRFSPDGRWIAFTSNRFGNNDVFVVPAAGGEPRQLTFHGGDDDVRYWTPDGGGIVFNASRSAHPFLSPLYVVPLEGGMATPLGMDAAAAGMFRQDGALIAYNRTGFNYGRKGYRGNNASDTA
jgi:tricorn protease